MTARGLPSVLFVCMCFCLCIFRIYCLYLCFCFKYLYFWNILVVCIDLLETCGHYGQCDTDSQRMNRLYPVISPPLLKHKPQDFQLSPGICIFVFCICIFGKNCICVQFLSCHLSPPPQTETTRLLAVSLSLYIGVLEIWITLAVDLLSLPCHPSLPFQTAKQCMLNL